MKTRHIITISDDEEPMRISAELQPGIVSTLITAKSLEEALRLLQEVRC